jgi:2-polyprenyl-6-methoxyphenol hydroxylase-like FAD-dependent oxidoreductase
VDAEVIVIGAGPTGLALAHELALGGAAVLVVEARAEQLEQVKGGAIQPRTAELLDARDLLAPMLELATRRPDVGGHFAGLPVQLDNTVWGTRHPYVISVPQWRIEQVLADAATRLGVRVLRDHAVTGIESTDTEVVVRTAGGELRAGWAVACDGGHSTVRKLLNLPFPGEPGTYVSALADIRLAAVSDRVPTAAGHISEMTRQGAQHWGMLTPVGDGTLYRFVFGNGDGTAPATDAAGVQRALTDIYGEPTRLGELRHASQFGDATRQLESYRHGRVLFAGDAAHIHPPFGGQGLNLGVQDGINLGWKLAATISGWAPDGLLDTYQTERHPLAALVLHHTKAQRVLFHPDAGPDVAALRDIMIDLMRLPDANRWLAGMMSGLDHLGRVPDLDLDTEAGPTRIAELLRPGRPVLLELGGGDLVEPVDQPIRAVRAGAPAQPPATWLIRPDGLLAWSGPVGERPAKPLAELRSVVAAD